MNDKTIYNLSSSYYIPGHEDLFATSVKIDAEVMAEAQDPCQNCEELKELHEGAAFNAKYFKHEYEKLQAKVAELTAKEFDWAKANAKCTDTIAQQAERISDLEEENIQRLETSIRQHAKIMSLEALVEKCEKWLSMIAESDVYNSDGMRNIARESLAAVAEQKS